MRKLNVHVLVKNLNKLCSVLDDEYNINCGGCCYVAYEIAKHLDRLGIGYRLHILNDYWLNDSLITQEVRSQRHNIYESHSVSGCNTCIHYFLVIEGGGTVNMGSFYKDYVYAITEINHRNIRWLYRTGAWNSSYRVRNNKRIKKIINSHFKQYGKSNKAKVCCNHCSKMFKMQAYCLTGFV